MAHAHIRPLSSEVIGQIAAGEVVERPAAAIKELVENSMDAGATAITVDIKEGGLASFRVVDNGSGIQPSDIRMAFERHATSKISTTSDLYTVQTLGFRGEALASIAAVSKMTCVTRVKNADFGLSVQNEGGVLGEIKEAACPEGTAFTVKDLFFNAPVRRKFMKKASIEAGYVSDLMIRMILSHPDVSFRYIVDGKTVYFSAGDGKLESAVMSIYGLDVLSKLKSVSGRMNGLLIDGFVGVGELSRGNRAHQTFILNGRVIKSNLLTAATEEACRQRVMIGRFPVCILHLTIPTGQADVNVHPNKWEVRFQNETAVKEAVYNLVYEALQEKTPLQTTSKLFDNEKKTDNSVKVLPVTSKTEVQPTFRENQTQNHSTIQTLEGKVQKIHTNVQGYQPNVSGSAEIESKTANRTSDNNGVYSAHFRQNTLSIANPNGFSAPVKTNFSTSDKETVSEKKPEQTKALQPAASVQLNNSTISSLSNATEQQKATVPFIEEQVEQVQEKTVHDAFSRLNVRLIGSVFNTYIILECEDRMLLCDQHAVHERILFERMMKACEGDAASQLLLAPELIHLTHKEYETFLESKDALKAAGFEAEEFGELTVQLRAVPMVLGSARNYNCLRDALDDLADGRGISTQKRTERIIQMACKHAVKGGEKLPMEELYELVRKMIADNVTPTCPHGRPLVVEVTHRELDKRFRRIQN